MKTPWSPAPFIPDESPWEERGPWVFLATALAVCVVAAGLTVATVLQLDGEGDQLRLRWDPKHTALVTARVVATQTSPARLSYAFSYPADGGVGVIKTVGVPFEVARQLRTGAKIDIICLRTDPSVSAPMGQAAIGTKFYVGMAVVWAAWAAILALLPLSVALTRTITRFFVPKPRLSLR